METTNTSTRIAGLAISETSCALVVLRRERDTWHIESARSFHDGQHPVHAFEAPDCVVMIDAAMFWQSADRSSCETDATRLKAAGWNVRAPAVDRDGTRPRNPGRNELSDAISQFVKAGRMPAEEYIAAFRCGDALWLAIWGVIAMEHAQAQAAASAIAPQATLRMVDDLLPHQRAVADQLAAWLDTDAPIAIVSGDHRSGKARAVEVWAKATGLKVETMTAACASSEEGRAALTQARRDVTVILDAGMMPSRVAVDALHAGRVVLVVNLPRIAEESTWLVDLVHAIQSGTVAGVAIECKAPLREVPPAVMKLLQVIDPAGAA